jgi:hypothetical protein
MYLTIKKYYLLIKSSWLIKLLLFLLLISSCIVRYFPGIDEEEELIVVEGLITDQPGINTIKISKSQPIWKRLYPKPLTGCIVSITDNLGNKYSLKETSLWGVYITDSAIFRGVPGRVYTLHIRTTTESVNLNYESLPMQMIPVPPIDSVYYEKQVFVRSAKPAEGCNIFLNTHDPSNNCRFYRWEYFETWEFHVPFDFSNKVCWISNNPAGILIKNASFLGEASVKRHPVISITDPVDRLLVKYSILVNQYSLSEDEYLYWERLKNTIDQVGGLYDQVPTAIPNNVFCIEYPDTKVLGYFSVSARSSRRLFIKDKFDGVNGIYEKCFSDTIFTFRPDTVFWSGPIIKVLSNTVPPGYIFTIDASCFDCTKRGTNIKPVFWDDDHKR